MKKSNIEAKLRLLVGPSHHMVSDENLALYMGILKIIEATQWRTIDSAPKDELEAIILWNGKKVTVGARWEGGFADWLHDYMEPQPTHWMPLPTPPETER